MIDFTSSLYLGFTHPYRSSLPWGALTTGKPVSLRAPRLGRDVARRLATLLGTEHAILGTSTLHLFWDLFGMLPTNTHLLVDRGVYAIARAGVERALGRGATVELVRHFDPAALRRALAKRPRGARSLFVCDGLCPGCGKVAPLAEYQAALQEHQAYLVVDDTQALGVLGAAPTSERPFGLGGGGSLRYANIRNPRMLSVSSLAKGFGVPLGVLAGDTALVRAITRRSETRDHSSPPSFAHLHAAARALWLNRTCGERLRARLSENITRFRLLAQRFGVPLQPGGLPLQALQLDTVVDPRLFQARLLALGVRAFVRAASHCRGAQLCLIVTASHTSSQLEATIRRLATVARYFEPESAAVRGASHVEDTRRIYPDLATFSAAPAAATRA